MYKEKLKTYIVKFKTLKLETKIIIVVFGLAFVMGGFIGIWNIFHHKDIYQVAVMVRSQNNPDPIEDIKTSLKYGDVVVVKAEDNKWSKAEKVSYLILEMKLTERQMKFAHEVVTNEGRKTKSKTRARNEQLCLFSASRRATRRRRGSHVR